MAIPSLLYRCINMKHVSTPIAAYVSQLLFCRISLLALLFLFSCGERSNKQELRAGKTNSPRPTKMMLRKFKADTSFVRGLLPISGDTLIAIKGDGGISTTTDAGKHWKTTHGNPKKVDYLFINDIIYDNHRVLWGLYSWRGIHEPSAARLAYSYDFGETWNWETFDIHTFFPVGFYSRAGQPLRIITQTGKVYQVHDLKGQHWDFIKHVPNLDKAHLDTTYREGQYNQELFDNARYKFLDKGQLLVRDGIRWKPVVTVGFIDRVSDVCRCDSSLYLTAHKDAINPSPYYLLRVAGGQVRHIIITNEGQNHLRCDGKGRLWVFSDFGVWQVIWGTALKKRL